VLKNGISNSEITTCNFIAWSRSANVTTNDNIERPSMKKFVFKNPISTMAKRKRKKGQAMIYTNTKYKIKDRATQTPIKQDMNSYAPEVLWKSVTIRHATLCYNSNITKDLFSIVCFSICSNYGSAIQYGHNYISP